MEYSRLATIEKNSMKCRIVSPEVEYSLFYCLYRISSKGKLGYRVLGIKVYPHGELFCFVTRTYLESQGQANYHYRV